MLQHQTIKWNKKATDYDINEPIWQSRLNLIKDVKEGFIGRSIRQDDPNNYRNMVYVLGCSKEAVQIRYL